MRCFHCKKALNITAKPGRGEECTSCGADLKVCLNCRFFEPGSYNECREGNAERVLVKDRANFCDFFVPCEGSGGGKTKKEPTDPMAGLKGLFKDG